MGHPHSDPDILHTPASLILVQLQLLLVSFTLTHVTSAQQGWSWTFRAYNESGFVLGTLHMSWAYYLFQFFQGPSRVSIMFFILQDSNLCLQASWWQRRALNPTG